MSEKFAVLLGITSLVVGVVQSVVACRKAKGIWLTCMTTAAAATTTIGLIQNRSKWRALVNAVMNLQVPKNAGEFISHVIYTGCFTTLGHNCRR
jgi:hypothetical protein